MSARNLLTLPVSCRWASFALVSLAVVLCLHLAPTPAAEPVEATGGVVLVLNDRYEVNFPSHVTFELTAESVGEITEVQLNYRVAHTGLWAYTYSDFSPGRRITASADVRTSGPDYTPPGTEFEYYYVIRDALGNLQETPRVLFEYMDTRFPWDRTEVGPLVLQHYSLPESRVDEVAREIDAGLQHIIGLLGVEPQRPVKGIIYNRRNDAEGAFPFQSQAISEGHVFQGFAFPSRGVFVGISLEPRLIVHELAHLLLHQALGSGTRALPAWLDEGFASYVEPGSTPYSGRSLSDRGLPLRAMATVPGTRDAISTFYMKSESVVAYLIEKHGAERFQQLLEQLRQGHNINSALLQTYGFDVDGLDARWAADTDGPPAPRPGASGGPSPFVYFDVWIIGGLALVVMVVLLVRYAANKLRPAADPEEGLQPWEDPDLWDAEDEDAYPDEDEGGRPSR